MYDFLRGFKVIYLLLVCYIVLLGLIDLLTISILYQFFSNENYIEVYGIVLKKEIDTYLAFLSLLILRFALHGYYLIFSNVAVRDISNALKTRLVSIYIESDYLVFNDVEPSSKLKNVLVEVNNFVTNMLMYGLQAISEIIPIILLVGFLFLNIGATTSLIIFLVFGFVYLVLRSTKNKIECFGRLRIEADEAQFKLLNYIFNALKFIKGNLYEGTVVGDASKSIYRYNQTVCKQNIYYNFPRVLIESSVFVLIVLILYMSTLGLIEFDFEKAALLGLVCMRILPSINKVTLAVQAVRFSIPSYHTLSNVFERSVNGRRNNMPTVSSRHLFQANNLFFSYKDKAVLENLSFHIDKGSKILIDGRSGAGKTTLMDILAGLIIVPQLEYSHELKDLKKYYLTQNSYIPHGRLSNFINFENPKINRFVSLLNLQSVLLKEGRFMDLEIVENSSNLSGGQIQRLSLLKALCDDCDLLLLDESTSGIDAATVRALMDYLVGSDITIVAISHDELVKSYFANVVSL